MTKAPLLHLLRHWRLASCALLLGLGLGCARAQAPTLEVVRADDDYPPFEQVLQGKPEGLHVEIVEAAAKSLGLRVKWRSLPWKRALMLVETGQADAITYISRTPDREGWAVFVDGNQLSSAEIRFIARKDEAEGMRFTGDVAAFLAQHSLVVVRGFQFGHAEVDRAKRVEGRSLEDLMRRLLAGHAQVAAVNWNDFMAAYQGKPEMARIAPLQPAIVSTRNYIAFSKVRGHEALAQRFAEAVSRYKQSKAYGLLLKKYQLALPP